jgi:glycosyltransferase involved in cell wall biosynthesis
VTDESCASEGRHAGATPARLFLSSEIKGDLRIQLGTAHYSYRLVADRFRAALQRRGYAPVMVDMPEKYKRLTDLVIRPGTESAPPVHIQFRSTENMRVMPAARNVCHFAWEFDVLRDHQLISEPVTRNQTHMLGLMDEIWVPSTYTQNTLRRYGLEPVHVIPTPVCRDGGPVRSSPEQALDRIGTVAAAPLLISNTLPDALSRDLVSGEIDSLVSRVRSCRERGGRIFLTIANPHDLRKNLLNAIDGFLFRGGDSEADILIVKLVVTTGGVFLDGDIHEHLARRYRGPVAIYDESVLLVTDFLSEDQMCALYSLADFYLSASHCEGFNLPLLEAMAHGALPVTTRNTAMCDYIDDANAILIRERTFPGLISGLTSDISGLSAAISVADRFDIAAAVRAARLLSSEKVAAMTARGRALVLERYSETPVMGLVEERLRALAAPKNGTGHAH